MVLKSKTRLQGGKANMKKKKNGKPLFCPLFPGRNVVAAVNCVARGVRIRRPRDRKKFVVEMVERIFSRNDVWT